MAQNEQSPTNSYVEVPSLIYRLCAKETKLPSDVVSHLYGATLNLIGSGKDTNFDETDEFYIMEKIKKKLFKESRESDALRIEELYHKMKRMGNAKNPTALLMFLFSMSNENGDKLPLLNTLAGSLTSSQASLTENGFSKSRYVSNSSTSLSSILPPDTTKLLPTADPNQLTTAFISQATTSYASKPIVRRPLATAKQVRPHSVHGIGMEADSKDVSEVELLREVLFAFQGMNGRILVQNPNNDNRYQVNPKYHVNPSTKEFALRLSNMGWLFNKVNKFCQHIAKDPNCGHVMQSFGAALNEEILEYYRLITVIEQQLHCMSAYGTDMTSGETPLVSLHRLQIWSFDHFYRMKMLAVLIENCKHKRGGSLASFVYKSMQHGDPQLRSCLTRILKQVVFPIRLMLSQWIFHGEIEDGHKEFFIITAAGPSLPGDALWHEKYSINKAMVPGFIPMDQAKKILATGKAINLLLQVSGDKTSCVPGYEDLKKVFEMTDVELLFKESKNTGRAGEKWEFRSLLQSAYKETSLKARKILFEDYRLMDHLNGLRQFLLLGQGDFIRHLMDLLAPELDKPAKKLQTHSLNSLLNSAIRATNAQFLIEDVINRVDCALVNSAVHETGWDIFTLAYQTKGPIGTILTQRCMRKYSMLFKHLWRSKRMEYVLSCLWKKQKFGEKSLRLVPRLKPVFYQASILLSEMTHFVQQMQYYIEFEVMECSWAEFIRKIEASEDIDQLVEAHEWFLEMVTCRSMVAAESQDINKQLRATYDVIIQFQSVQEELSKLVDAEVTSRSDRATVAQGDSVSTLNDLQLFDNETIPKYQFKIKMLAHTYQSMVQDFLMLLASNQDMDLQFLSVRLDFNEHYKKRNKCLETSLTYSHRMSFDTSK